ncbi:MAG: tRNA pseudouridine(55) synthase, partial [Calditrichaeota bacterium]
MTLNLEQLYQGEIVPIDKPVDWTSFDVVNKLRYATKIKKVGHAGTLDPFATGLLLVCFAKATKRVENLVNLPKEYIARFKFGITSDSHDITGKISQKTNTVQISETHLKTIFQKYSGEIEQIPPMFSALK